MAKFPCGDMTSTPWLFFFSLLFLQAYDQHLNMILSEVEETITTVEIDEETFEELFKVCICFSFNFVPTIKSFFAP